MYPTVGATAGAVGGAAALPVTGTGVVWYMVAGFTLVCAGLAAFRLVPRRSRG